MDKATINLLCKQFDVDKKIIEYVTECEKTLEYNFEQIELIREYNQLKVIAAMQKAKLDATHFNWTTGYGFDDKGREKAEEIYSYVFNTEDALVRPTIVSGTHAITLTLTGLLRPNDELLSITGSPYDTLQKVIGVTGNEVGTLKDYGISYNEIPLLSNDNIDIKNVLNKINNNTKVILIQRSTGYSDRKAITIEDINKTVTEIKKHHENIIIFVDNCYGEFIEKIEPTDVGVDIIAGSLIKNAGGGLALTGGYIAGKKYLIEQIANRSTAPGIGKECGLTFGTTRNTLQGLFLAPNVVYQSLKGALLTGKVFKNLGYKIVPDLNDSRSDIIQGIKLNNKESVIKFCQGVQSASPVDSHVLPIPWAMPGYEDPVIMAAGAFIQGSSIELSADAPIRKPYYVYFQGGLTYDHCKLGIIKALNNLYINNLIDSKKLA